MFYYILISFIFSYVYAGNENKGDFKNQFCTDPRTFKKHPAYSEWADAYSCTRHRCQPGGRSLAIYTVGCKRVEPPEAAIECEEVVEDTNMQFPFCCTRLRCLVIVRGEVWTKVLGQPWETLSAAPWSHMYKMKRPPPNGASVVPKETGEGPVFELATESPSEKRLRNRPSSRSNNDANCPECERPGVSPDIVIALTTGNEDKEFRRDEKKNKYAERSPKNDDEEEMELERAEAEFEDKHQSSSTKENRNQPPWTDIPQNQWVDTDSAKDQTESKEVEVNKPSSPFNLQALVDAISTRMRDIENVVQKMSEKVTHDGKKTDEGYTGDDEDSRRAVNVINEESTTEASSEDNASHSYTNSKSTRRNPPSEPLQFIAPVETNRKTENKRHHHKKHSHSGRVHKKTRRNKKVRKEINAISLEDDSRMS